MPPRPRQPGPTIYLDTSTLSNAFSAHDLTLRDPGRPDVAFQALLPWIERVAAEANLCVSVFHLKELACWGDHARADALVQWIAGLPTVWTRGPLVIEAAEADEWLRAALGCRTRVRADPFAPSMVSAMEALSLDATVAALRNANPTTQIQLMLDACRATDATKEREHMPAWASAFRHDRAWAESEGWSEEKKAQHLANLEEQDLRGRAREAHARLRHGIDVDYPRDFAGDVGDALVDLVSRDPRAMPSWRVERRFVHEWAARAAGWTPGSQSHRQSASTMYDYVHLSVGAAYCDVFTCDGQIHRCLGDVRDQLGLPPALTMQGLGPGAFVTALIDSLR